MKQAFTLCIVVATLAMIACSQKKENHENHTQAQETPVDTLKKSIPKEEHAMLGAAHVTIKYHSPAVRGRVIWGGLVPYDQVWVTGAHSATSFEIDKSFNIQGKTIPAGKYAIFTIPGKKDWQVIFNKNWEQHLADEYNEADDVARVTVTPVEIPASQERLYYNVTGDEKSGFLVIRWEKVALTIPFTIAD